MPVSKNYVLQMEGLNLYVSNKQGLTGCNVTKDVKKAMVFSAEYDSTQMKLSMYNVAIQRLTNNSNVKFEVKYL